MSVGRTLVCDQYNFIMTFNVCDYPWKNDIKFTKFTNFELTASANEILLCIDDKKDFVIYEQFVIHENSNVLLMSI